MAYFNHAFRKTFLATGTTRTSVPVVNLDGSATTATTDGALLVTAGLPTVVLNQLSKVAKAAGVPRTSGYVGFFDPKTHLSVVNPSECCPLYLAGSAIQANDKIGPFHGGYTETNKSKTVNPKYVSRLYYQEQCPASSEVVHVGNTQFTGGLVTGISILTPGSALTNGTVTITLEQTGNPAGSGATAELTIAGGIVTAVTILTPGSQYLGITTIADAAIPGGPTAVQPTFSVTVGPSAECNSTFLCNETYSLRVDIKGSPVLRFLNRNTYFTADAYTGCCPDDAIAPVPVDSTLVYIEWAKQLVGSPLISPFIQIVITAADGTLLYAPGTVGAANTWDTYVSPGYVTGQVAGMTIFGAYVDTKFGDCTFQTSDFFEKEPVKIYTSMVDYTGDPCEFQGLCVVKECEAKQAEGFGEQVARDFILSEAYRQNFFHSDLRIREITQGNQILEDVDRSAQYDRVFLLHSVPRFNNPSSTFDNDQYLLEFAGSAASLGELFDDLEAWLEDCGTCNIEAFECSAPCESIVPVVPVID